MRDALEYACPFTCEEPGPFADEPLHNAATTKLSSLGLQPKQVFLYLFDFGDEWLHEITVEAIDAKPETGKYPRVLEKHGQSPPQYPELDEE